MVINNKQKGFSNVIIFVAVLVLILGFVVVSRAWKLSWEEGLGSTGPKTPIEQVACTMEAKLCPDGSSVGRSGPKCEFAACPTPGQGATRQYNGITFSLSYPADILIYPKNPSASDSLTLTNKENVTSPLELPEDGILVEVTKYPASAKTNLISDLEKILSESVNTTFTHPITPYPNKYKKMKNISNNGVLIQTTEGWGVKGSREVESALWLKNNVVHQLRIVAVTEKAFTVFEPYFNQMIDSLRITN